MGMILTPEFEKARSSLVQETLLSSGGGGGKRKHAKKKQKKEKVLHSSPSSSSDDEDLRSTSPDHDSKRRRRSRSRQPTKASKTAKGASPKIIEPAKARQWRVGNMEATEAKMRARCKTLLWVKGSDGFLEVKIPFEFDLEAGGTRKQWAQHEETGIWYCNVCHERSAGGTFDPAPNVHRLDSKLGHNSCRKHRERVRELAKLPEGQTAVEWVAGDNTYEESVERRRSGCHKCAEGTLVLTPICLNCSCLC